MRMSVLFNSEKQYTFPNGRYWIDSITASSKRHTRLTPSLMIGYGDVVLNINAKSGEEITRLQEALQAYKDAWDKWMDAVHAEALQEKTGKVTDSQKEGE